MPGLGSLPGARRPPPMIGQTPRESGRREVRAAARATRCARRSPGCVQNKRASKGTGQDGGSAPAGHSAKNAPWQSEGSDRAGMRTRDVSHATRSSPRVKYTRAGPAKTQRAPGRWARGWRAQRRRRRTPARLPSAVSPRGCCKSTRAQHAGPHTACAARWCPLLPLVLVCYNVNLFHYPDVNRKAATQQRAAALRDHRSM
jgi:hypothetical protein